jgi:hypothetical protein
VEGSIAILQIRIFKDDLEEALRRLGGLDDSFRMEVSPGVDSLFLRYVAERFVVQANGQRIMGRIVGSGEDELDREPVWNVQLRFDAPEAIRAMRITYTVLFEVFDDQRNVLRVVKFPEERRLAYYFAEGEETVEISFQSSGGLNRTGAPSPGPLRSLSGRESGGPPSP